jgi:hypothetical protein
MDHYEIQVVGDLDQRRAGVLGCDRLRLLPGGGSVLVFAAIDQTALYGLLGRLRDAGLELVAARRISKDVADPTAPPQAVPAKSRPKELRK